MSHLASRIDSVSKQLCDLSIQERQKVIGLALQAEEVYAELKAWEGRVERIPPDVLSALAAAAARVAGCAGKLEADFRCKGEGWLTAGARFEGACSLLRACSIVTFEAPSFFSTHQRALYGCLQLALGPGRTALATAPCVEVCERLLVVQALLVTSLMDAAREGVGDVAGFATRLATPAALLGWLGVATQAAEAAFAAGCDTDSLFMVGWLLARILQCMREPAFAAHADALRSSTQLAAGLARALSKATDVAAVAVVLPAERRPASFTWPRTFEIGSALDSVLYSGLQQHLGQGPAGSGSGGSNHVPAGDRGSSPGSTALPAAAAGQAGGSGGGGSGAAAAPGAAAWRYFHSMLTLLVHAPESCPAGMDSDQFASLHSGLFCQVGRLVRLLDLASFSAQQCRQAAGLVQRAMLRLPQALQPLTAKSGMRSTGAGAGICSMCSPVIEAWSKLLTRLMEAGDASQGSAAGLTAADIPTLCAAAVGLLRALPPAAELSAAPPGLVDPALAAQQVDAFVILADASVQAAYTVASACCQLGAAPGGSCSTAASEAVWKLHSTLCSAAHWLAGSCSELLGEGGARAVAGAVVASHMSALTSCLFAVQSLQPPAAAGMDSWLAPLAAAHVEAVTVLGEFVLQEFFPQCGFTSALMAGLAVVPLALFTSPAVERCMERALQRQVAPGDSAATASTHFGSIFFRSSPPALAAWLLGSSRFPSLFENLALWAVHDQGDVQREAASCQVAADIAALASIIHEQARTLVPATIAYLAPEVDLEQRHEFQDGAAAAHHLAAVLPLTRQLAGAVLEWYRQPEQLEAAQLEAARAAVARSCANLRCPNVGLEGGPAAGQGVGCMRCSKCRVAYYCSTACSHPDWRAGHRKVCAELAAARQAQRGGQSALHG